MTPARRVALAGLAAIGYAVFGARTDDGVNLVGVLGFLAAVLIGHELIVLPITIGVGFLVTRRVPPWFRPWVQSGLFASAVVTVVSIPLLVGAGRIADNPCRLPLNYWRGLAIVLAVIWLVALTGAAWSRRRTGAGGPSSVASTDGESRDLTRITVRATGSGGHRHVIQSDNGACWDWTRW